MVEFAVCIYQSMDYIKYHETRRDETNREKKSSLIVIKLWNSLQMVDDCTYIMYMRQSVCIYNCEGKRNKLRLSTSITFQKLCCKFINIIAKAKFPGAPSKKLLSHLRTFQRFCFICPHFCLQMK